MRAVDEARLVAGEKERCARHFLRLANAALLNGKGRIRHIDTKLVERVDLAQSVRRTHEPRTDGVAADVLVAILDRDRAGEHVAGALRRIVDDLPRRGGDGKIDDVQTIDPPPAAIMPGSIALVMRNMLVTLTAISQSHSASVVSRKGLMMMEPA